MFTLLGTDAYPAFRLRQLEEAASRALGFPVSLQASWIYLLDAPAGLGDADVVRASDLLEAVGRASPREKGAVYVAPRKGTISPWSSKASDIFRSCGLGKTAAPCGAVVYELCAQMGEIIIEIVQHLQQVCPLDLVQVTVGQGPYICAGLARPGMETNGLSKDVILSCQPEGRGNLQGLAPYSLLRSLPEDL